jgi:hypothetical protein
LAATFAHDEDGVSALCAALSCFEVQVAAIERPEGLLVDRLLESGVRVLALHPNQVKAARDRFRASGGKSDHFDRFVLCELARTDAHRFRVLEPDSDETKALRALTRAREDLVAARVAMAHQLRAELERFWPGPVGVFAAIDSPISLAFLIRYPSPADARGLGEKRLAAFLKAHHFSTRGHNHARALRTLGRAWSRIIWNCWQKRTPYDPGRHPAHHSTSPSPSPIHRPPGPTSSPPSGWPALLPPHGRPAGPSAQRLTASRHPPSRRGVDTGRLLRPSVVEAEAAGLGLVRRQ